MRVIFHIIRKEFLQLIKDRPMLGVIFIMPVVQLFVLSYAITTDIQNVSLVIRDLDKSMASRALTQSLLHSQRFRCVAVTDSHRGSRRAVESGRALLSVNIPRGFSRNIHQHRPVHVQIVADGVDSNTAMVAMGYARKIILKFFSDTLNIPISGKVEVRSFYNPELESRFTIVPGIMAVLLTIVTTLLTALSIVKEREIGTLEQLNVTPIRPFELVMGKVIPFVIIGGLVFTISMLITLFWFRIPMEGRYETLALVVLLYLLTTLGVGLFISTVTSTQQQSVFLTWFILVTSILMSGFMFPISNMPEILQRVAYSIPLTYFISALRAILLKGADFADLQEEVRMLLVLGTIIFSFSVLKFKKRVK